MASKRDGIIVAAKAALELATVGAFTKPAGLTVHRMRHRPIGQDALPALVLWFDNEPREEEATDQVERTLRFWTECRVKHAGVSGDEALDPLLVWSEVALMDDPTLGGRCQLHARDTVWDLEARADPLAAAAIQWDAIYPTNYKNPEIV